MKSTKPLHSLRMGIDIVMVFKSAATATVIVVVVVCVLIADACEAAATLIAVIAVGLQANLEQQAHNISVK